MVKKTVKLKPLPRADKATILKAVEELRGFDHAFISEEGCHRLAAPFGVRVQPFRHNADPPGTFKGLTFNDGAKSAVGMDAQRLAMDICWGVDVQFDSKFGRGSQLRACCDALEQWAQSL